jgi:DNA-binding protein HU-beta
MISVNKRDLAKSVAIHSDVQLSTVQKVLDGFADVVTAVVSKGEPVVMTGFAKFTKVERSARMGRNPATGEQIRIKASKRVRIAPAKAFKDGVLSPTSAPKLARGAWPLNAEAVKLAGQNVGAAPKTPKAAATKKTPAKRLAAKRPGMSKTVGTRSAATARKAPAKQLKTRSTVK